MNKTLQQIMVVEDDEDIQKIIEIALVDLAGYTIKICNNGQEGLNSLSEFKPDLILLDVMMPEMDGPTTLKKLRELPEFKLTPVVFLTAKVQTTEIAYYRLLGALDVIMKPFDPVTLADQLQTLWDNQ